MTNIVMKHIHLAKLPNGRWPSRLQTAEGSCVSCAPTYFTADSQPSLRPTAAVLDPQQIAARAAKAESLMNINHPGRMFHFTTVTFEGDPLAVRFVFTSSECSVAPDA